MAKDRILWCVPEDKMSETRVEAFNGELRLA